MKKIIFKISFLLFFSICLNTSFPQAGKNIKLINHLDPRKDSSNLFLQYSALWGYIAPDNREYALLGAYSGTYFIDITDSNNTSVVGFVPAINGGREMKTYSHYAYIISDFGGGLQIVDLQYLPDSIRHVRDTTLGNLFRSHTISQSGPYLYFNGGSVEGIAAIDLTINPERPVLRGKWTGMYVHDTRIMNDTIYACNIFDDYVTVIDAGNKDSLKTITRWVNGFPASPHNCAISNPRKFAYVADELNQPGRLKFWNIEDLGNITFIGVYIPPLFENCTSHNVELYDNQLVAAYYQGGMKLFDVSNPYVFNEIGWYDTYPEDNTDGFAGCWGVYKFPSGKIIASDMETGLYVLRYNPPINERPKCDFMAAKLKIYNGDSLQFYDCASNNPSAYSWKFSGPASHTSTLANPKIRFINPGMYSVKLKVSNVYGTDSLEKINYITVDPSLMNQFHFTGQLTRTIHTNSNDTSTVKFYWTKPSNGPDIRYNFTIRKLSGGQEFFIASDNNGTDTIITLRKSYLDTLALTLGMNLDSVRTISKVFARNSTDSISTLNSIILDILRDPVGIINTSSEIPDRFRLIQNFPNPFNPVTKIRFDVAGFANVNSLSKLTVFDALGQEVVVLLNEHLSAGSYQIIFDGSSLPSGIYFYEFKSGIFIDVKRMVLLK